MQETDKKRTNSEACSSAIAIEAELELLRDAAAEAGQIAMRYFGQDPQIWMKEGNSPVSEADLAVDAFLKKKLLSARPDYGWISEETADEREKQSRTRYFVVDPIDGTRSFLNGKDQWCVSIAIIENERPLAGVLDVPVRKEVFSAEINQPSQFNGQELIVPLPQEDETLPIALPRSTMSELPASFRSRVKPHPYISSLAYRIAMIARGDIYGTFVRPNAHDWDLAAADLILQQAGGSLVDSHGQKLHYGRKNYSHGALVAGSDRLLKEMLAIAQP